MTGKRLTKSVTVRMTDDEYERLKRHAESFGCGLSQVFRLLLSLLSAADKAWGKQPVEINSAEDIIGAVQDYGRNLKTVEQSIERILQEIVGQE